MSIERIVFVACDRCRRPIHPGSRVPARTWPDNARDARAEMKAAGGHRSGPEDFCKRCWNEFTGAVS